MTDYSTSANSARDIKPLAIIEAECHFSTKDNQVEADKSRESLQKTSGNNAIHEFIQKTTSVSDEDIRDAVEQLGVITLLVIFDITNESGYEIALANIYAMRSRMVDLELPEAYNGVIEEIKKVLIKNNLARHPNRHEFWSRFKKNKLGLIKKTESNWSRVSEEDAQGFYDTIYMMAPNGLPLVGQTSLDWPDAPSSRCCLGCGQKHYKCFGVGECFEAEEDIVAGSKAWKKALQELLATRKQEWAAYGEIRVALEWTMKACEKENYSCMDIVQGEIAVLHLVLKSRMIDEFPDLGNRDGWNSDITSTT